MQTYLGKVTSSIKEQSVNLFCFLAELSFFEYLNEAYVTSVCHLSHPHPNIMSQNKAKQSSTHKRGREFFAGHRSYWGGGGESNC
jgi:hypothetical protein